MKTSLKLSLVAALVALAGISYAKGPMGDGCDGMRGMQPQQHSRMGKMDPARMQARMDQRNAALKTQLKITPQQEALWTAFTESHKPAAAAGGSQRPDPAEMAKLSTPERLDRMQQLRAQHMGEMSAAMEKRTAATKALYAALTPEQQKIFDTAAMPGQHRGQGHRQGMRQG